MRGRKTTPEVTEQIHSLRLLYGPEAIAEKLGIPRRTVAAVLRRTDSPEIEAKRREKRIDLVERVWEDTEDSVKTEVETLKAKRALILDHMTPAKVKNTGLRDLGVSYGILFDKQRLLEGKATSHVAILALAAQQAATLDKPAAET